MDIILCMKLEKPMIEITKLAIENLRRFSTDEGIGHLNIRIKIIGFGCAGMGHDMTFEELPPTDFDEVIKIEDITVYIDGLSMTYMKDVVLDWFSSPYASGFKFLFKNEEVKSCGCGNSFSP